MNSSMITCQLWCLKQLDSVAVPVVNLRDYGRMSWTNTAVLAGPQELSERLSFRSVIKYTESIDIICAELRQGGSSCIHE